jgi:hypothetical protein
LKIKSDRKGGVTNPLLNPEPRGPGLLCQGNLSVREIASNMAIGPFPSDLYSVSLFSFDIQQALFSWHNHLDVCLLRALVTASWLVFPAADK